MRGREREREKPNAFVCWALLGGVPGFDGPFDDDVPNLGDLYNLQATGLGHCAALCTSNPACQSFEFSPTAGAAHEDPIKNCQIASGTNRAGTKWRDFSLYVKKG